MLRLMDMVRHRGVLYMYIGFNIDLEFWFFFSFFCVSRRGL